MQNFIFGLLLVLGGSLIIIYHQQLYRVFGGSARFEKNMWDSRQMFVLIGACLVVIGVLLWFGIGGDPTDTSTIWLTVR